MRTLLLMRHAKSSWDQAGEDWKRPLNKRGESAAPRMGRWLSLKDAEPDVVLSSTAVRAQTTAELVISALESSPELRLFDGLYHPDTDAILDSLACHGEAADRVLLVCHNPGISVAVSELTGEYTSMPTAALAVIEFDINNWSDVLLERRGTLAHLWRVKELPDERPCRP
jgi:phosphohistidine phosphatase